MRLILIFILCQSAASCDEQPQTVSNVPHSFEELEKRILTQKNYREALFWAKKRNKKVLLYFNGYACVNCGKYRSQNWTEENLILMDSLYEVVDLKVDDPTPLNGELQFYSSALKDSANSRGKFYQHYQYTHFSYTNQPFYVIVNKRLNPLATYVDDGGIQGFTRFLMQ